MLILIVFLSLHDVYSDLPDSVDVMLYNNLDEASIVSAAFLPPNEATLLVFPIHPPIDPGCSSRITIPYRYMNRAIFTFNNNTTHSITGFAPDRDSSFIELSLSTSQFGVFFDRVNGTTPAVLKNGTSIPFIQVLDSNDRQIDLLNGKMLLPGELLRVWSDSGNIIGFTAVTASHDTSAILQVSALPLDTVHVLTPEDFLHNGCIIASGAAPGIWILNQLPDCCITKVEVFSEDGYCIAEPRIQDSSFGVWDKLFISCSEPVSFVLCTDSFNRTYSIAEVDTLLNMYICDQLSLDFNFGFPERN